MVLAPDSWACDGVPAPCRARDSWACDGVPVPGRAGEVLRLLPDRRCFPIGRSHLYVLFLFFFSNVVKTKIEITARGQIGSVKTGEKIKEKIRGKDRGKTGGN